MCYNKRENHFFKKILILNNIVTIGLIALEISTCLSVVNNVYNNVYFLHNLY